MGGTRESADSISNQGILEDSTTQCAQDPQNRAPEGKEGNWEAQKKEEQRHRVNSVGVGRRGALRGENRMRTVAESPTRVYCKFRIGSDRDQYFFHVFLFFFFKIIASPRYNSDTIKFTHLKHIIWWVLVYSQTCGSIPTVNFRTFSSSQKKNKTYPLAIIPPAPTRAPQSSASTILLPVLWICLWRIFHIKKIIFYLVCVTGFFL